MIRLVFAFVYLGLASFGLYHFMQFFDFGSSFKDAWMVQKAHFVVSRTEGSQPLVVQPILKKIQKEIEQQSYFLSRKVLFQSLSKENWVAQVRTSFDFEHNQMDINIIPKPVWAFIQHEGHFYPMTNGGEKLDIALDLTKVATQLRHIYVDDEKSVNETVLRSIPQVFVAIERLLNKYNLNIAQYWLDDDHNLRILVSNGMRIDFFETYSSEVLFKLDQALHYLSERFGSVKAIRFISSKKAVVSFKG